MNFCPNCGARLESGQSFCSKCGFDIRERARSETQTNPEAPAVHGLGRNALVWVTQEGLRGVEICSRAQLYLAVLAPLAVLAAVYYEIQAPAPAVYITIWAASSALLYDELRWRGAKRLGEEPLGPGNPTNAWLVPWRAVRMADWNGKTLWFSSVDPWRKLSVTFDSSDAPLVERSLGSCGVRYSWRGPRLPGFLTRFSTLALLVFIAGQAILILAATLPFFPGEEQLYTTIANNARNQVAGTTFLGEFQALFSNNIQVALGGAIPFLGTLVYGIASYNTGRAVQAIAITHQPQPVPTYLLLITLYILPHTWVEESAYPIATVAGLLAFTTWRSVSPGDFVRKSNWGSIKLAAALSGATAVLVAAGLIETLTSYLGDTILVLWIPLGVLPSLFLVRRRRKNRAGATIGTA